MAKKVLLAPLDPVHDVGLKLVRRALDQAGHKTVLLPPDLPAEEIVQQAVEHGVDAILVGRTLGYNVPEVLARLVDVTEAAGLRPRVLLGVGGMAIRPELAAELGYDRGFGPGTSPEEAVAFVEGREFVPATTPRNERRRADLVAGYSYAFRDPWVGEALVSIARSTLGWAERRTSPALARAAIRQKLLEAAAARARGGLGREEYATLRQELLDAYLLHCDRQIEGFYRRGERVARTRPLTNDEIRALEAAARRDDVEPPPALRHGRGRPAVFVQYGTGCPFMDIAHVRTAEAWGADGVVHFDPSWSARREGLMEGYHTHEQDGSLLTLENLKCTGAARQRWTLWQVRAHRGLNTPETVVLARAAGADLTKVNPVYGSLGAGTDPERLLVDAAGCMHLAAEGGLPFDVVTNEELCGVPAAKAFAGMLIVATMGRLLGGEPILQPLFCLSPDVMINGQMDDNYVDYNAAKVLALRELADFPIWPGAPIGFLTHTEDRVQSATTTALHAALAAALEVDAISIASTDEAYSGGAISAAARVDTLRATGEAFRFLGRARVQPTPRAGEWAQELVEGIRRVLTEVLSSESLLSALNAGVLGSPADGAYPGRAGRGTVTLKT